MQLALILAVAGTLAAPSAARPADYAQAEKRLRSCLVAGSVNAPHASLAQAVPAVRALCAREIKTMRELRVTAATAGLDPRAAEQAEARAVRKLNEEIALAIANFTGLRP